MNKKRRETESKSTDQLSLQVFEFASVWTQDVWFARESAESTKSDRGSTLFASKCGE
ncbi:hypothetical protein RRSWK_01917 [Rhodopirellula sp. SWK7]|nr:hypothetical protein RRSWK_01917 [Rhodopirellula sp. SWK7]